MHRDYASHPGRPRHRHAYSSLAMQAEVDILGSNLSQQASSLQVRLWVTLSSSGGHKFFRINIRGIQRIDKHSHKGISEEELSILFFCNSFAQVLFCLVINALTSLIWGSFFSDSICVTKKLDIDSNKLGDFSFADSANDVFVLQNGINRFNGKWKMETKRVCCYF
jgi:hypothetical protein